MKNSKFTVIKLQILCLALSIGSYKMIAQNNLKSNYRLGLGVGAHLSGNAHCTIYNAFVSLYNGKNYFSIGPCFQKCKKEIAGAGFRYMRILSGQENFSTKKTETGLEDTRLQLFVFAYGQYLNKAKLSHNNIQQEEKYTRTQTETNIDYSKFGLSTTDVFAGFGINKKISQKFVWGATIGFGTYYHLNYDSRLYAERIAPVLMIGTALRFNYLRR